MAKTQKTGKVFNPHKSFPERHLNTASRRGSASSKPTAKCPNQPSQLKYVCGKVTYLESENRVGLFCGSHCEKDASICYYVTRIQ